MSVQDLDVALNATFSSASQKRLYELGAYNNAFGGDTLPTTVERYLQVLCDPTVYALQRRWVGLVLRKMVDTSKDTVRHLETLSHTLPQLGAVLLRNTELEETKIVVGILMREMISNGVDFDSFWLSEKIPNNVPYFPLEDGHTWMASFQSFLDTFDALKLMDSETDPVILYPIALSGSDGFKWRDPEPVHSVAIIQDNSLTIVAPDVAMRRFVFVDIPLDHIQSTHLQKSTLHDSQARTTEYNPWDIVLSLTSSTWTYRVNAAKNTGSELTILFANHRDAEECQGSIMEIKNTRKQSSLCKISSSEAVLDVGTVNKDTRGSKGQVLGNSASVGQAQG
jgi:hypothetical protein